jgi:flagellar capping protein FliD
MENNFKGTKWTIKQPKGISWITIMSDKTEIAEISSSLSDDAQDYISKLVTDAQAVQTQIDCSLSEFLERFKAMEKFLKRYFSEPNHFKAQRKEN